MTQNNRRFYIMIGIDLDEKLEMLYGRDAVPIQKQRYEKAVEKFIADFGEHKDTGIFSAPGRTEIGGNHTDHNGGCVLAAAVGMDTLAFACPTDDNVIEIHSEGFNISPVDVSDLTPRAAEQGTSEGLIRGVAAGLKSEGFSIGGFKAYTSSDVISGSGLSSSAAFEVLVGTILSHFYNEGGTDPVKLAQIAQYSENVYFGKPSGLMDQMASSVGGFITIDFKNENKPVIEKVNFDFSEYGYYIYIVDTKGSHEDLTAEYSAIPSEMKAVAGFFGKEKLREISREQLWANISPVREKCGDRAVARALHFFDESERAVREFAALERNDINEFFNLVNASGNSSYKFLQNIHPNSNPSVEPLVLGLYAAEDVLCGEGACRVHGGGFAGTIQAFVPASKVSRFVEQEEKLFGKGSCHKLFIRPVGGYKL